MTGLFQSNFDFSSVFNFGCFEFATIAANPPFALFGGPSFGFTTGSTTSGTATTGALGFEVNSSSPPNNESIALGSCDFGVGTGVVDLPLAFLDSSRSFSWSNSQFFASSEFSSTSFSCLIVESISQRSSDDVRERWRDVRDCLSHKLIANGNNNLLRRLSDLCRTRRRDRFIRLIETSPQIIHIRLSQSTPSKSKLQSVPNRLYRVRNNSRRSYRDRSEFWFLLLSLILRIGGGIVGGLNLEIIVLWIRIEQRRILGDLARCWRHDLREKVSRGRLWAEMKKENAFYVREA